MSERGHAYIADPPDPPTRPTDTEALDRIQSILTGSEWHAEHLEWVAEVVESTGRIILAPSDATCLHCEQGIDYIAGEYWGSADGGSEDCPSNPEGYHEPNERD